MNVLLMSAGGGGGNILRSVKAIFRRDLVITQKSDPKYADRLRRAVVTRFLDTNEFSLLDVPHDERLLIGAGTARRLGSGHNPDVARAALEESRREVEALFSRFSVIVLIGTGGKGTGAGTLFPLAQMARAQHKLVIPIFVRPSFERHEVEKARYDHAVRVSEQFDAARIRLMEILNDRGYADTDPQPQSVVWERMNHPIARGLRGLLYVLSDLSQVDPSDLSVMFAGQGRIRIGFSEIDASDHEPSDDQVQHAVRDCWDNPYYAFDHSVGTSLICVQGEWSNVVDANIKGRFAALAHGAAANGPYNPLYARAVRVPRPWGVTTMFAEYTGNHPPLQIDWTVERKPIPLARAATVPAVASTVQPIRREVEPSIPIVSPEDVESTPTVERAETRPTSRNVSAFDSVWEFAKALNRLEPEALALAADGRDCPMSIDVIELRKLLTTFWVRSVFPRLSADWRDRLLAVLLERVAIPNYALRQGRRTVRLSDASHEDLTQIVTETIFPDAIRADLQLLIAVGTLWGENTLAQFEFTPVADDTVKPSRFGSLLHVFRGTPSSESPSDHRQ